MTATNALDAFNQHFDELPLVAILRGLRPEQALEVGAVLVSSGFRIVEVPLNSPKPFDSIAILAQEFGKQVSVGSGTVLNADAVNKTIEAGGKLIIAPNLSSEVAAAASQSDCVYCPGIATPTEAFSALQQGAHALKLFPAEMITPNVTKAMRAVLPQATRLLPVGGITTENMKTYRHAGANGFGIGSALFKAEKSLQDIEIAARQFIKSWQTSA